MNYEAGTPRKQTLMTDIQQLSGWGKDYHSRTRKTAPSAMLYLLYLLIIGFALFSFPPLTVSIGDTTVFRPDWAIAGLLIIAFVLDLCLGRQKIKKNMIGNAVLVLNVIAILTLSKLFNSDSSHVHEFLTVEFQLLFVALLFFAISSLELRKGHLKKVMKLWISTALFVSLYGIYQTFARNFDLPGGYIGGLIHGYGPSGFAGFIRPSAFFAEASWYGNYLIAPILLMGIALLHKKDSLIFKKQFQNVLVFSVMLIGLFLSFSLAAYAILGGVAGLALLNKYLRKRIVKIALVILIVVIGTSYLLQYLGIDYGLIVATRIKGVYYNIFHPEMRTSSSAAKSSLAVRLARTKTGLRVWLDHPLLGVGLNNYSFYGIEYGGPRFWTTDSYWVQALAEGGIIFFGALALLYSVTLVEIKRCVRIMRVNDKLCYIALTAFYYIIWAQVLSGFLTYSWVHTYWWFHLSLACLLIYTSRKTTILEEQRG